MRDQSIRALNEYEGKLILAQWGIPVIAEAVAAQEGEAVRHAERLGYPVALKVCSEAVLHKTEKGGVILNITDTTALNRSLRDIETRFKDTPHSLLVQKMASPGIELILGARRDPVFGPVVLAGIGGVFTEVFRDTALEITPVGAGVARAMLDRLRGSALLKGFRGQAAADHAVVVNAIVCLSQMMVKRSDILEVDINPFIVHAGGAVAVDALVRISSKPESGSRAFPEPATMDPFFNPRSLALIGASRSHGKGGNIILRNIMKAGFKGVIHPINPSGHDILGLKTHENIRDIGGAVDLAMIVIPKNAVREALEDCAAKGVKAVILSTGGYSDIGDEGALEQKGLVEMARRSGMRLMGPNSIGTIHPAAGLSTSIVGLEPIAPGGVSLIGQSGVFSETSPNPAFTVWGGATGTLASYGVKVHDNWYGPTPPPGSDEEPPAKRQAVIEFSISRKEM